MSELSLYELEAEHGELLPEREALGLHSLHINVSIGGFAFDESTVGAQFSQSDVTAVIVGINAGVVG